MNIIIRRSQIYLEVAVMSKAVSGGQARSLIASFAVDTPWDAIETDVQPFIELPPEQKGKMFAAFVENNFRVFVGKPKVIRTKFFDPARFIGKDWRIWRGPADGDGLTGEEDMDPRRDIAEIEIARIIFETCLKEGENSITGEEKLSRQKKAGYIRLGGNTFLGFWEDYQANKENSVLEWLYQTRKITYLDFFGDILRDPSGSRRVLCLDRSGDGRWGWSCGWLGGGWGAGSLSAGYATLFISPSLFSEGVLF